MTAHIKLYAVSQCHKSNSPGVVQPCVKKEKRENVVSSWYDT